MVDFQDAIKEVIRSKDSKNKAEHLMVLWEEICKCYEEGSDVKITDGVKAKIDSITGEFDRIYEKLKERIENGDL
jgi:hypothetical protein